MALSSRPAPSPAPAAEGHRLDYDPVVELTCRPWRRALFVTLGLASAALGFVGVFVPGLPTTIFVIIASYCFARSSPRLDRWLREHRWFGPSLRRYQETGGMRLKAKAVALTSMWTGLLCSWIALAGVSAMLQATTLGLGLLGTATILLYVRTVRE